MPNVHPLIVHFPIALFLTGFVVDGLGWLLRRERLKQAGLVMVILGALTAIVVVASGLAVEETVGARLEAVPGGEAALEAHEEIAILTTVVLLAAGVLRLALASGWLRHGSSRQLGLLAFYLIVGVIGLGLLTVTGYRGGELVYRYGAGIQAVEFSPPLVEDD